MTVLVLTDQFDVTADHVVALLSDRGVPVFRCDTAEFPQQMILDARLMEGRWCGELINAHGRSVLLEEIRSVWYRRPTHFVISEELTTQERKHAAGEARYGFGGVLAGLDEGVLWMNAPGRDADAGYKPAQLAVAERCGFVVPETLVTNDAHAVHLFHSDLDDAILVNKLLGGSAFLTGGRPAAVYTTRLGFGDLADLRGITATAHLFQRWLEKRYEVRVTVVGERCFTVAIHAGSPAAYADWRSDYEALTYEVIELPSWIRESIVRFQTHYGLSFGAFDFVVTPENKWIFLECNTSGEFGWIEHHTELPMSEAIADLLQRGHL
jgi:ATP-grasp ribosomal peptide maturase